MFIEEVRKLANNNNRKLRDAVFEIGQTLPKDDVYWLITSLIDQVDDDEMLIRKLHGYVEVSKEMFDE